eukprot:Gb_31873 [translate_table: standard]
MSGFDSFWQHFVFGQLMVLICSGSLSPPDSKSYTLICSSSFDYDIGSVRVGSSFEMMSCAILFFPFSFFFLLTSSQGVIGGNNENLRRLLGKCKRKCEEGLRNDENRSSLPPYNSSFILEDGIIALATARGPHCTYCMMYKMYSVQERARSALDRASKADTDRGKASSRPGTTLPHLGLNERGEDVNSWLGESAPEFLEDTKAHVRELKQNMLMDFDIMFMQKFPLRTDKLMRKTNKVCQRREPTVLPTIQMHLNASKAIPWNWDLVTLGGVESLSLQDKPQGKRRTKGPLHIPILSHEYLAQKRSFENFNLNDYIMAAAEARAAWQRTANRCFVQEDAKRAPKLACCPSAGPLKSQSDPSHCDSGSGTDQSAASLLPVNWNSTNINLSPDTRWWLQWQPSFGNQRDFTCEHLKDMKSETGDIETENEHIRSPNSDPDWHANEKGHHDCGLYASAAEELNVGEQTAFRNQDATIGTMEEKDIGLQKTFKDIEKKDVENVIEVPKSSYSKYWHQDYDWMLGKQEHYGILEETEKYYGDTATSRSRDKSGLSWRTADKDELATLVAQKSLEHVENCDLPPPRVTRIRKGPLLSIDKLNPEGFPDSIGQNISSFSQAQASEQTYPFSVCGSMDAIPWLSSESHYPSTNDGERASSSDGKNKTWSDGKQSFDTDGDKARLLEALCHSQTRAREAEKAAAQAFLEKEQLLKLFLKEASHLFAYRQWLQLLQIESLCLQIKSKEQSVPWDQLSALFPVFPWKPLKHKQWTNSKTRHNKRHKCGRRKPDISTWALAVALGLSLAGAVPYWFCSAVIANAFLVQVAPRLEWQGIKCIPQLEKERICVAPLFNVLIYKCFYCKDSATMATTCYAQ